MEIKYNGNTSWHMTPECFSNEHMKHTLHFRHVQMDLSRNWAGSKHMPMASMLVEGRYKGKGT